MILVLKLSTCWELGPGFNYVYFFYQFGLFMNLLQNPQTTHYTKICSHILQCLCFMRNTEMKNLKSSIFLCMNPRSSERFSYQYHDILKRAFYQINPYFKSKPVCSATPVYFQLSAPLQSRCGQSYISQVLHRLGLCSGTWNGVWCAVKWLIMGYLPIEFFLCKNAF